MRLLFVFFDRILQSEIKSRCTERVTCTSFVLSNGNSFPRVTLGLFHHEQDDREAITNDQAKMREMRQKTCSSQN
jgi:hypothetical protein